MDEIQTIRQLIQDCQEGSLEAKKRFQDLYGSHIYSYFQHLLRDPDQAGDVYVYAFENNRLFKRLSTFQGEKISFLGYLKSFVLRDLFLEWLRRRNKMEMAFADFDDKSLYPQIQADAEDAAAHSGCVSALLTRKEFFILKLLYLNECDLSADDLRYVADFSGRSLKETLLLLSEIWEGLYEKRMQQEAQSEKLNEIFVSILSFQNRLISIKQQLSRLEGLDQTGKKYEALLQEKAELERKLAWRYDQQQRHLKKTGASVIKTSYKEIARLLNCPLGTVCTRVSRARSEFKEVYTKTRPVSDYEMHH